MILIIDNYDSFTYNLFQYLGQLAEVVVKRNDRITLSEIEELGPSHIVISPGPGRPEEAGISERVIEYFKGDIPILGICLGHQCIADVFGAKVIRAGNIYHGKTSLIYYSQEEGIFQGIENPLTATRYHSLIVEPESVPEELKVIARTGEGEIMAIRHLNYPVYGLQFHPESILTESGLAILKNFIRA